MRGNEIIALIEVGRIPFSDTSMAIGMNDAMASITKNGTMYLYKFKMGSWKFHKLILNVDDIQ